MSAKSHKPFSSSKLHRDRSRRRLNLELLEDRLAPAVFTVINTNDSGAGSLRQAILDANGNPGADSIEFAIGVGSQSIAPLSSFPALSGPVTIDGATQPGYAGSPLIELNGTSAGSGVHGLEIGGGSSLVRGLVINRFGGNGIRINSSNNQVAGNFIGLNTAGSAAAPNGGSGIALAIGAANNFIGTNGDGLGDAQERNVLSGNAGRGVLISGTGTNENVVAGNLIGLNATGTAIVANTGNGVEINGGAQHNRIGADGNGVSDALERNIISGNANGVRVTGANTAGNTIAGNFIGTDITGTLDRGNATAGVGLDNNHHLLGNTVGGNSSALGNLISGNQLGIRLFATDNAVVQGNRIGTNDSGTAAIRNDNGGILADGGTSNALIGGIFAGAGNLISGNAGNGIFMSGASTTGNTIQGNQIGTNASGTTALANTQNGILIAQGANHNLVGGSVLGARNLISGNTSNGVAIGDSGSNSNVVSANWIGVNATGDAALPNNQHGIIVFGGASDTRIGTNGDGNNDDLECNLLSGNHATGIGVFDPATLRTVIAGNYIGTNAAGTAPLPNRGSYGVQVDLGAKDTRIGTNGSSDPWNASERNIISGNLGHGIGVLGSATTGTMISGNYIGLDASGQFDLGNGTAGVTLQNGANQTRIGTNADGQSDQDERNVISGNGYSGVYLQNPGTSNNVIAGNYIGLNADGNVALGNTVHGVFISFMASDNLVGGLTSASRNVISGNTGAGVRIRDQVNDSASTSGNKIWNNYIGTDVTGTHPLGNSADGVSFQADFGKAVTGNQVGGPGLGNLLAFNQRYGIGALGATATGNTFSENIIHHNVQGGIDLQYNGPTPNDLDDADTGPNDFLNFPVLDLVLPGAMTRIIGAYQGLANTTLILEFFASTAADPSGYGQGERFLGSTTITTDAAGRVAFEVFLVGSTTTGEVVSATATDPSGNTSEFSRSIFVNTPPNAMANGPYWVDEGGSINLSSAGSNDPDGSLTAYEWDFDYDGVTFDTDATGTDPLFSSATLDGHATRTIALRVTDDLGRTAIAPTSLEITNAAPTVSLTGPSDGSPFQPRSFTFFATDPGDADTAAGFTYHINWGDGQTQTIIPAPNNGSGVNLEHAYANMGTFTVQITAEDKDGAVSLAATQTIAITSSGLQIDPLFPDRQLLSVGGTPENDLIDVSRGGSAAFPQIKVHINGVLTATYAVNSTPPLGRIVLFGGDGDDFLRSNVDLSVWCFGGNGNDRMYGGPSDNVLHGGPGSDELYGQKGRDLIIGGESADLLVGGPDDDLVIGDFTAFDANDAAWQAIWSEWTSSRDYPTRVANLRGTGQGDRSNGDIFLKASGPGQTVFHDLASDFLRGDAGLDWFFASSSGIADVVFDLIAQEERDHPQ